MPCDCIVVFLQAPKTTQCNPPPLARDFRLMFTAAQLGDWKARTLSAAEVIGKGFAVYPTGLHLQDHVAEPDANERL